VGVETPPEKPNSVVTDGTAVVVLEWWSVKVLVWVLESPLAGIPFTVIEEYESAVVLGVTVPVDDVLVEPPFNVSAFTGRVSRVVGTGTGVTPVCWA